MSSGAFLRTRRLVVLAGAGIFAFALVLALGQLSSMRAHAVIPAPGLNYYMEVEGEDGCDTTSGDTTCYIEPGSTFTVAVVLDSLPDGVKNYEAFEVILEYTGLTSEDTATGDAFWPECGFPAQFYREGLVAAACSIGIPPAGPSTYTGVMVTNDFTCSDSGTITLRHGEGNTILLQTVGFIHAEGAGTGETLNIVCGDEPTATPRPADEEEATPLPTIVGTGTGGSGSGESSDMALWIIVSALAAVAATSLGAFGWRAGRSR
jgi:hypothetical protein